MKNYSVSFIVYTSSQVLRRGKTVLASSKEEAVDTIKKQYPEDTVIVTSNREV